MSIIVWIIFGLIAGTVANHLSPSKNGGIVSSIILGIVGAVVGGFIGNALLGVGISGFNLSSFLVAIAGALLVLLLARALKR